MTEISVAMQAVINQMAADLENATAENERLKLALERKTTFAAHANEALTSVLDMLANFEDEVINFSTDFWTAWKDVDSKSLKALNYGAFEDTPLFPEKILNPLSQHLGNVVSDATLTTTEADLDGRWHTSVFPK
jgi:hypothetical protein